MKKPTPIKSVKVSKAEQRVIIAKDALNQLRAEKFIAQNGVYVGGELSHELDMACKSDEDQARPLLLKTKVRCRVCAKGALFLSTIRKYNKATVADVLCDDFHVAEKIFGDKMFNQIEAAFEQWDHTKSPDFEGAGEPAGAAYTFGIKYSDDTERLVAILKNIIKNKGTFKP